MAKDPAALFYIARWLVATKEMRADERGWYLNLVLHQYDKGDLPSDVEELANLCDVRFSEYDLFKQKWQQVLQQKFEQNANGRLENSIAKEIIMKRRMFVEKRATAGKMSYVMQFAKKLGYKNQQLKHIKENIDIESVDTKDKQMLEQVFKQMFEQKGELYINININKDKDKDITRNTRKGGSGGKDIENIVVEGELQGDARIIKKGKNINLFVPPTLDEWKNYCKNNGYGNIADRAYKYYSEAKPPWTDSAGKKIRGWKQKLQGVWFREENRDKSKESTNPMYQKFKD